MTGDGKLLKILCLTSLFLGLAAAALGIVFAVGNLVDIDAWITAGQGALATIFGVRSSILANVPSNTSKIQTKALVVTLCSAAVVAALVLAGFEVNVAQIAIAGVICVVALAATVIARRIVKEQLRK